MLSKRGGGALQSRSFEHLCLSMLTSLRENAQCKGKGRARFIVYQIDSTISLEKVGEDLPQKKHIILSILIKISPTLSSNVVFLSLKQS